MLNTVQFLCVLALFAIALVALFGWMLAGNRADRSAGDAEGYRAGYDELNAHFQRMASAWEADIDALKSQVEFLGAEVQYASWTVEGSFANMGVPWERSDLRPLAQVASDLRKFRQLGTPVSDAEIAHARREIDDIFG